MAENNKTLPDIKGTETIANTWRRLLERDRNASNLFSGEAFTTGMDPIEDVGRPNWRTDLQRLFIYDGTNFVNLFNYLTPQEIQYTINHPDVPEGVADVKSVLDLLVRRNNLNTVVMPTDGLTYLADGTTFEYSLSRYESNKNTVMVFIDGVKQNNNTFELSESGESIIFEVAPAKGETIEIIQNSSLLYYDYSPVVNTFTGDGTTTDFTTSFEILNPVCVSINVDGKVLQLSEYNILSDSSGVRLKTAPTNGANIQIITINKTSFITVSPASIGANEIKDNSITANKMAEALPVNMNSIPAGGITNNMLANNSIDSLKLADNSIITSKLTNGSVTKAKLAESVQNSLLGDKNVIGANLADGSVSIEKLGADVKAQLGGGGTISGDYYTKEEIDAKIGDIEALLAEV